MTHSEVAKKHKKTDGEKTNKVGNSTESAKEGYINNRKLQNLY